MRSWISLCVCILYMYCSVFKEPTNSEITNSYGIIFMTAISIYFKRHNRSDLLTPVTSQFDTSHYVYTNQSLSLLNWTLIIAKLIKTGFISDNKRANVDTCSDVKLLDLR